MLIHPATCECQTCVQIHKFTQAKSEAIKAIYDNHPEVARKADELHKARMMAGPTCEQCILSEALRYFDALRQ